MIPSKEEISSLSRDELARKYSVCSRTIQLWRRAHGINKPLGRSKRYDVEAIDKMIAKGMTNKEIRGACGCGIDYASRRRRSIQRQEGDVRDAENTPFIPLLDRERIAWERKTKRWTPEHRAAFISVKRGYLDLPAGRASV